MSTERVNVVFGADTGPLRSGVNQAKQALGGLRSSVGAVAGAFGVAIGGTALVAAGRSAIQAAADFEALKLSLESVKDANESVDGLVEKSRELAKMPGLGLNEVVKAFIQLKAIGQTTQGAENIIREIGNAAVRGGGGIQQFEQAIYAIQQIAGNGRVMGQDLNQLKNAIPSIGAALKEAFGSAAIDSISDADKEAGIFLQKLLDVLATSERVQGGIQNNIDNLGTAWTSARAALGEYIALLASPAMASATKTLEEQSQALREFREQSGDQMSRATNATGMGFAEMALRGGSDWLKSGWRAKLGIPYLIGDANERLVNFLAGTPEESMRRKMAEDASRAAQNQAARSRELTETSGDIFEQARLAELERKRRRPEMMPGNAEGRAEFERLEAAKRYYAFLESKRALRAGISEVDQQLANTSQFAPLVTSDFRARGFGGAVYGGAENPVYKELQAQRQRLEDQITLLEGIETNTARKAGMKP